MILMQAPGPNMSFGGMPSGAIYASNQNAIIVITNDSVADMTALAGAGCYTLSPFGGWGTFSYNLLSDLYAADTATSLVLPGTVGFPANTTCQVMNDPTPANNGTWYKTGPGNGSGNWTFTSALAVSGAIAAAASAAAASASAAIAAAGATTATAAVATVTTQAAIAQAAVLGLPYYPTINASTGAGGSNVLPQGITSGTVGGTAITGATPGTYALTPTGGSFTGVTANLVVTSATAANIVILTQGRTTSASPTAPSWANPSGATIPAGTTLTANIGTQIANGTGQYYVTSDSTGSNLLYWQNTGTGAPVAVLDGAGNQVKYPLSTSLAAAIAQAALAAYLLLLFPKGYGPRSGVVWATLDKFKRLARYVSAAGVGYSNIPETFNQPITPLGGVVMGSQTVSYLTGFKGNRSGWDWGIVDSFRRVITGGKTDGTFWHRGNQLLTSASIPPGQFVTPGFAIAFGDSLTAGTGASNSIITAYPPVLAGKIGGGFVASNQGIGGQVSQQIGARAGGNLTFLTVSGNTLPAGGTPVSVTAINGVTITGTATAQFPDYRLLSTAAGNGTTTLTGYLCGVHGTLTRTATGGPPSTSEAYSWTSDSGAASVFCPVGAVFVPDNLALMRASEAWICVGRNDLYNDPTGVAINQTVTQLLLIPKPAFRRSMVFGVITATTEGIGTSFYNEVRTINQLLRQSHPREYVVDAQGRDLRERLVASYNPSLALDVIAFNNDTIAPSLHFFPPSSTITLTAGISASQTTITTSAALTLNQVAMIGTEQVAITAVAGTTATITRGYNGTTAATASSGAQVIMNDPTHLNDAGYAIWAQIGFEFRQTLLS